MDTVITLEDRDVALIRLSNDIKENDFVSPVCVQFGQQANQIDSFESAGWNEMKLQYSTIVKENAQTVKVLALTKVKLTQFNIFLVKENNDFSNNCPLSLEKLFGVYGVVSTEFGPQWYLSGVGSSCGQSDRLFSAIEDGNILLILNTLADLP